MPDAADPPLRRATHLSGNYEYLTEGYYECQDAELAGVPDVLPTCGDALDAYVVPIALVKAERAGLAVPEWFIANEYFPVPVVCYGVNPFSRKYAVVRTEAEREVAAKQLTWNYKYTVCCQRITPEGTIAEFRMVAGRTETPEFADWAAKVFDVFHVPMALIRLLRNGRLALSAIEQLPSKTLTPRERAWVEELRAARRG